MKHTLKGRSGSLGVTADLVNLTDPGSGLWCSREVFIFDESQIALALYLHFTLATYNHSAWAAYLLTIVSSEQTGTQPEASGDLGPCQRGLFGQAVEDLSRSAASNLPTMPRAGGRYYFPVNIALNKTIKLFTKYVEQNLCRGFCVCNIKLSKTRSFISPVQCPAN